MADERRHAPSNALARNVPISLSIVGQRDFDGDGKATSFGATPAAYRALADERQTCPPALFIGNVPTNWSIAGTGDFNGDGKADILWRDCHRHCGNLADERR